MKKALKRFWIWFIGLILGHGWVHRDKLSDVIWRIDQYQRCVVESLQRMPDDLRAEMSIDCVVELGLQAQGIIRDAVGIRKEKRA